MTHTPCLTPLEHGTHLFFHSCLVLQCVTLSAQLRQEQQARADAAVAHDVTVGAAEAQLSAANRLLRQQSQEASALVMLLWFLRPILLPVPRELALLALLILEELVALPVFLHYGLCIPCTCFADV